MMDGLSAELLALYRREHEALKAVPAAHPGEDMAGPLLMAPDERYTGQPHRLLIVGQETGGWHYHVDDPELQMEKYREFNVGEQWYASPFWNVTRKVEKLLGNQPYSCAWTNVSKFDHKNGRAVGRFAASIMSVDHLLVEELRILKPTVCLFYTGPDFDMRLCGIFPGVRYSAVEGYTEREMARLEHVELPSLSFRTYHPNYLRRSGMEEGVIRTLHALTRTER